MHNSLEMVKNTDKTKTKTLNNTNASSTAKINQEIPKNNNSKPHHRCNKRLQRLQKF